MSDAIKHECGIAFIRLKKPLEYYRDKYNSALYGLKKLYLLMEKQHNRGQDGAGIATIKFDLQPGSRYIARQRSNAASPIKDIFGKVYERMEGWDKDQLNDIDFLKREFPFAGELLIGHLRYGTSGGQSIEHCHPFLRQNNWMSRNLVMAGNFNITNVDELFNQLTALGQHPKEKSENVTMLEKIGHFLDEENQELFDKFNKNGLSNEDISHKIAEEISISNVLKRAFKNIDGGYSIMGLVGHGDGIVIRDPHGIRPAFWYEDDEVVVVTSERPAIQTAFNVNIDAIKEIKPGHALIVKKNGQVTEEEIMPPQERASCTFERIYFSRGNDRDIYKERKELGNLLSDIVLEKINYDFDNTVFSYIPNTASTSFYGLVAGLDKHLNHIKRDKIVALGSNITTEQLEKILAMRSRREKIAIKDAKLRTFITDDEHRDDLVAHVYDVTYCVVKPKQDTLVVVDDSIVRGTTLKLSILKILDRLGPKKIIVVSSAPQIRFPDCYGIDMSKMKDFVAFRAVIELINENGYQDKLQAIYEECKLQIAKPIDQIENSVKKVYAMFTDDEITAKIGEILTPEDITSEVEIVYQTIDNLHKACPDHKGDWYFSGNYPTPGGNKVAVKAFMNYMEGKNERGY